jgi:F-type H+-transporting ATPase subunit alpha
LQSFVLIDSISPSIKTRSRKLLAIPVGLYIVDTMYPVANGQRELIIGDRQTGKTSIILAMINSQCTRSSAGNTISMCWSGVAQRIASVLRTVLAIGLDNVRWYTNVVSSSVTTSMSAQFMSPLSATAVLELCRNSGYDCGIGYDDLSKHAVAYRQLCLYLKKPAGREAFPSDVFYLHARILERSCALSARYSAGTLMSLPIIETLGNDLSAYIATNVISITDGQLYMDVTLFGTGLCPAVSSEKSVSRVGAKSLES